MTPHRLTLAGAVVLALVAAVLGTVLTLALAAARLQGLVAMPLAFILAPMLAGYAVFAALALTAFLRWNREDNT